MVNSRERWRIVGGYPQYDISDCGGVRNRGTGRMLKPYFTGDPGYMTVDLGRKNQKVHRLVLMAFVGKCPDNMQCRHLDGNPSNNNLGNLKWGTPQENGQDMVRHGTHFIPPCVGVENGRAILTEKQIREIRQTYKKGTNHLNRGNGIGLSIKYGVNRQTILDVATRKRWGHVQ